MGLISFLRSEYYFSAKSYSLLKKANLFSDSNKWKFPYLPV